MEGRRGEAIAKPNKPKRKGKSIMNTITEHEALTNMARGLNLTIHEKHQTDGRKKIKEYFAQRDKATLSPVLPFEKLNLFLLGWRSANK